MGKPKKNELDMVLEQLKKSYSSDADLEDSLLETEKSEEDIELSAVLQEIFSDKNEFKNEPVREDEKNIEDDLPSSVNSDNTVIDKISDDSDDLIRESDPASDVALEKKAVDGVLEAMFGNSPVDKLDDSCKNGYEEVAEQNNVLVSESDKQSVVPTLGMQEKAEVQKSHASDDMKELDGQENICSEDAKKNFSDVTSVEQDTFDGGDSDMLLNTTDASEKDDGESELAVEVNNSESNQNDEPIETECVYAPDVLQHGIDEMPFIKIVGDIAASEPDEVIAEEETETDEQCLDNGDITLMLKFQYGDELKRNITDEQIYDAISEKERSFEPAKNRIPHGFCGSELTDRVQVDRIRKKYSQDKKFLMIAIAAISLLLIFSFIIDISFMISADKSMYVNAVLWELIFIVAVAVLLSKKLFMGIVGIVKFEINKYSLLTIVLIGYCLYSMSILIAYDSFYSLSMPDGRLYTFGTYAIIHVLATVICDFFECKSEMNTFGIIADNEELYTAEKRIDNSSTAERNNVRSTKSVSHQKVVYNIMTTHLVGGYFEKLSRQNGISYPIYAVGVVPALSILLGCVSAILNNNILYGLYSAIFTLFLCVPFVTMLSASFYEFFVSRALKKKNTAFIGYQAVNDYSCVEELVFNDGDAVETISCIEINPNKGSQSTEHYLAVAHEVLWALGGTLRGSSGVSERLRREIIINAISDNGIDIYFDSAMNVLIGDRQYMLSNKIKVKTDTSLSHATKGNDRSVIYMAFDGKPRLGFIVTNKIRDSFAYVLRLLDSNGIGTVVRSYEPHINDDFFSRNDIGGEFDIRVLKKDVYEPCECRKICSGSVISTDITGVAEAIVCSKNIVHNRNKFKGMRIAVEIVGIVMSIVISLLIGIPNLDGIVLRLYSKFYASTVLLSLACVLFWLNTLLKKKENKK